MWWRPRKAQSIAARLFLSAIFWSLLLLLIAGIVLTALYRRTAEQSFDQRLDVYLRAIVADITAPGDDTRIEPGQLGEPQFELSLSGWYWQITRLDTSQPVIRASRSLFAASLPRLSDLGVPAAFGGLRRGYATGPEGSRIRILERQIDNEDMGVYLVQVAATTQEIDERIRQFEWTLAVTFVVLALSLAGASALQVRFGLRPLRRLQEEVAAIRRGETERIDGRFPEDLSPLAGELNLLISSNREILQRARTQVGNLAHALKTPISVLMNEARAQPSPLAEKVGEQAAIMSDQVSWYLDRARAAARANVVGTVAEVAPSVEALLRTFDKIYDERAITFTAEVAPGMRFRGEKQDFEEMVGNLLDNAGKWAETKVELHVALTNGAQDAPQLEILIDDDGPGLPEAARDTMLKRGQRLDETKPGSGLGLSIVADLAAIYGGRITLEASPLGGARAWLVLPAAV
jgi:signal transduction histidine kinase